MTERDKLHTRLGGIETKVDFIYKFTYEFFKKNGLGNKVAVNTDSINRLWGVLLVLFMLLGGAVWFKLP